MRLPLLLPLALQFLLEGVLANNTAELSNKAAKRNYDLFDYYVLHHNPGALSLNDISSLLELEILEPVGELKDHWLLRTPKYRNGASKRTARLWLDNLSRDHSFQSRDEGYRRVASAIKQLSLQTPRMRIKRTINPHETRQTVDWLSLNSSVVAAREGINDPLFSDQWHLVNDENPVHMVNTAPVWDMGITGEGVISTMVDDGLDFESDDLAANFVSNASTFVIHYDLQSVGCCQFL